MTAMSLAALPLALPLEPALRPMFSSVLDPLFRKGRRSWPAKGR